MHIKLVRMLVDNMQISWQCKRARKKQQQQHFVVSAFAALTGFGTFFHILTSAAQPVLINSVMTSIGVSAPNTAEFTCPSTAVYFIHYRLFASQRNESQPCFLKLVIGRFDIAEVSFVKADCTWLHSQNSLWYAAGILALSNVKCSKYTWTNTVCVRLN